jgi:DNA end-binding protein Ku
MAPRAVWKGFLKLANVACSVKLTGATTEAGKLHFRTLNRRSRMPVKSVYVDEETGDAVERDDQVKGYELEGQEFLVIEPEEIAALKVKAEHTVELDRFVDFETVPSLFREKPYLLYPADKVSSEAFAVMREAMERRKLAGVAAIVLYQRERPVVVEPLGKGLLMTTLRYANWVVDAKEVFSDLGKVKVDPEMAEIASMIIEKKAGHFDPTSFEDKYENALFELIKAKQQGKKPPKPVAAPRENVVNLADVLRKSLEKEGVKPPAMSKSRKKAAASPAKKRSAA